MQTHFYILIICKKIQDFLLFLLVNHCPDFMELRIESNGVYAFYKTTQNSETNGTVHIRN